MYHFEKERIHFKTNYIDKICKPSKRLDCLRKARCEASAVAWLTLSPPLFTLEFYPASPDDPLCNSKLDFGRSITVTAFIS